ncbi:MAG: cysteine desulfurase / selenocysteine lyase [Thermoplasmata archaeon]|nr:cysteine desulfurase / selenocysteine lyase [Thermoplasmata archaeon]
MLDVQKVRREFPILAEPIHGKPLVYLDNAATTQKPRVVIEALRHYYEHDNANIHRGVHLLSERATKQYEDARKALARHVGAKGEETVLLRGTTEAINLVAQSFVRPRLKAGDEVLITEMEHHSNIVPWQMVCEATGAKLRYVPITDTGELDMAAFPKLLGPRTKFMSVVHASNALGTVNPVADIVEAAHAKGVPVLVDGAQAVGHLRLDLHKLGADFYAASGHKMYGPTGVGFLHGKREHLEAMPPWQGGGDMIRSVSLTHGTTYNDVPHKFEAGTPHIAGGIGLGTAVQFIAELGVENIAAHEHTLVEHANKALGEIPGLRIIGTAAHKSAVVSFALEGIHPHDVGSLVDRDGIAIRTGHHCAQPVMERYGLPATNRASFAAYNTKEEVDLLAASLQKVVRLFA